MKILTPQDRLQAVEHHAYQIQAVIEALRSAADQAYQGHAEGAAFNLRILADRLQAEVEGILAAAGRED